MIRFATFLLTVLVAIFANSGVVYAAINPEINYQGKLTGVASNQAVADGDYHMEFKLYTTSTGGSPIWTETRTSGDVVSVQNGLFSVMLGEVTSLAAVDFNQALYLGVNIGGSSGSPSWDGEMTPRKKIGAVPAAFNSDKLDGLTSSDFLSTTTYSAPSIGSIGSSSATTTAAGNFIITGTTRLASSLSGILKATAGYVTTALVNLATDVTGILGISNGGTGTSTAPSYGQLLVGDGSGGYNLLATSSLGISGGSSQWSDSGSNIYFDTGNVAVGTTPDVLAKLAVSQNLGNMATGFGVNTILTDDEGSFVQGALGAKVEAGGLLTENTYIGAVGSVTISSSTASTIGVLGIAGGGLNNYAGYFIGDVFTFGTSTSLVSSSTQYCLNNDCITSWSAGSSQWDDVSGGINYAGGNIGVGTSTPWASVSITAEGRYGSNEITNPYFSGDATNWSLGTGWAYDSDDILHTPGNTDSVTQAGTLIEGGEYIVFLDVNGGTAGSVDVCLDGGDCQTISYDNGVVVFSGVWSNDAGVRITITPTSDFDGSIDNVQVKKMTTATAPALAVHEASNLYSLQIDKVDLFSGVYPEALWSPSINGQGTLFGQLPFDGISTKGNLFITPGSGGIFDSDNNTNRLVFWDPTTPFNEATIGFSTSTGNLTIEANNVTLNEGLTISSTGYVGVGTSTPNYPLAVSGEALFDFVSSTVRISQFNVNGGILNGQFPIIYGTGQLNLVGAVAGVAFNSGIIAIEDPTKDIGPSFSFVASDFGDTGNAGTITYTTSTQVFNFDNNIIIENSGSNPNLGFNSGAQTADITLFDSNDTLSFLGASGGYTFDSPISVTSTATSTFAGDVQIAVGKNLQVSNIFAYSPLNISTNLNVTGVGTSTFANGIALTTGCITVGGVCMEKYSTTSADYWITTKSTTDLAEGSRLYWTDTRFDARLSATTSLPNITTLGGLSLPVGQLSGTLVVGKGGTGLGSTPSYGQLLVGNGAGYTLTATSSLGIAISDTTGTLAIDRGGTNATSQSTNGVNYFNGTSITSGSTLVFDGTNLGVGSSTPGVRLSVAGDGWFDDSGGTTNIWAEQSEVIRNDGVTNYFGNVSGTSLPVTIRAGGADRIYINNSTGNVGVGTSTPADKLVVENTGNANNYRIFRIQNFSTGASAVSGMEINAGANANGGLIFYRGSGNSTDPNSFWINNVQNAPLVFANNNSEKARINTGGNFGIGTTSPAFKLEVAVATGDGISLGDRSVDGNLYIGRSAANAFGGNSAWINFGEGSTNAINYIAFGGNGASVGGEMMRLDNGNLGIGTTTPAHKLQVAGSASFGYIGNSKRGIFLGNEDAYGTSPAIQGISSTLGGSKIAINPTGDFVGIGTTTPNRMLTIWKSGNRGEILLCDNASGVTDTTSAGCSYLTSERGKFGIAGQNSQGSGVAQAFTVDQVNLRAGVSSSTPNATLSVNGAGTGTGLLAQFADSGNTPRVTFLDNGNVGIGATTPGALLDLGTAGSKLGVLRLAGNTSGNVTVNVAAAAGTWTLTLPTSGGGTNGFQLTTNGSGVTSWTAAGSVRSMKNIDSIVTDPNDALNQILATPIYKFHYKEGMGTGDSQTQYIGVMADEAPWAMHYAGQIINPVNTLGYLVLGIQATNQRITQLENSIAQASSSMPLVVGDNTSFEEIDALTVQESATFYGLITVIGDAAFESKVVFKKEVEFQDHVKVDSDTAGSVVIKEGDDEIEVTFDRPYAQVPRIVATLQTLEDIRYAITDKTVDGFTISLLDNAQMDLTFDWIAFASDDPEPEIETPLPPSVDSTPELSNDPDSGTTIIDTETPLPPSVDSTPELSNDPDSGTTIIDTETPLVPTPSE